MADFWNPTGFSGCAFINVAGELHTSPAAWAIAREHKLAFRVLLHLAARDAEVVDPETFADRLVLLVEGAIVTAYVEGDEFAAAWARSAAAALLECAGCA